MATYVSLANMDGEGIGSSVHSTSFVSIFDIFHFIGLHGWSHLVLLLHCRWSFVQSGRKFCSRRGTDGNRRQDPATQCSILCCSNFCRVYKNRLTIELETSNKIGWLGFSLDFFSSQCICNIPHHCNQVVWRGWSGQGDKIVAGSRLRASRVHVCIDGML